MKPSDTVFVAGGDTLLGGALVRQLERAGFSSIVNQSAAGVDLADREQVERLFSQSRLDYVFLAGGRSGGIQANVKRPASLIYDNLLVQCHVIDAAHRYGVKRLLYLASSCTYPRAATQPLNVASLWTGPLEPTNEPYAVAKLAGIKMCDAYRAQYGCDFVSAIPADAFGIGDNFSPEESHVVPALLRRMHEAKVTGAPVVDVWGSGLPRREFIFADDVADACIFVMREYTGSAPINVGSGVDMSIRDMALLIKDVVGYEGELVFRTDKPDGMPLKILDSTELRRLGWRPSTATRDAVASTYEWFLSASNEQRATSQGLARLISR